ncbi:SAM-dependent methyltransferase [Nocardia fluminea]|uniref:S-adenosyl methyltransferase n=1 Tax=Nocardia fluminea TaxID=134984 RepID=A0A2N3VKI4_9NOCA|nr:SAM-dependent methyltransferase [Nocardia fluminea]PKV82120.1 S-adenosyl methyltransferase [Nocardia fluminea]
MSDSDFEPRPIDTNKPSSARIYHHMITGEVIFESDLPFIHRLYNDIPFYPLWAQHNRRFLARAVRYMAGTGIRQFLDIGSGLPTGGNTHEVAREIAPDSRVVYVDNDEEAINRARDLLREQGVTDTATMVDADLREPARILAHPDTQRLIDFSEPVGLLLVSVLPWVTDASEPAKIVAHLRDALAPGSHIAMTHVSLEDAGAEIKAQVAAGAAVFTDASTPVTLRTRAQFQTFFDGWTIADPGITYATDWRPEQPIDHDDYARPCNFAAIGSLP